MSDVDLNAALTRLEAAVSELRGRLRDELGVSGDSDEDAGSPRSAPFPMTAIPIASGDRVIRDAAAKHGIDVIANPQARNSVAGYQDRPQCCGNATC